ncbi:hypothetical protein AB0I28_38275 [Phytomonospora sp. NPDC050363]|uniref:hypothetical protein n=1 Tax=Phytomonospora sp. NPDC050363 TaxID=3155642 RepID=UPI0033D0A1D6
MNRVTALILSAALTFTMVGAPAPATAHAAACVPGAENDFDGDGLRDLAVGTPLGADGGRVLVTYTSTGSTVTIGQQTSGVPGSGADGDLFGFALASYDRDADGCDELVVGGPGKLAGGAPGAGMVWILPGARGGLNTAATEILTQNSTGFPGVPESGDLFGHSLAAGLTGTQPYLAIGSPGENLNDGPDEGHVYYLRAGEVVTLHQDKPNVADESEPGDWFGETVVATPTHVIVSVSGENSAGADGSGAVAVFAHRFAGASLAPLATVGQDSAGVSDAPEPGDAFGGGLSAIPYRPEGAGETGTLLAVSAVGEDLAGLADAGMAQTLFVSPAGLVSQVGEYTQAGEGVEGEPEADDMFGTAVRLTGTDGAAYATPATATLTLTSAGGEDVHPGYGAVQVFALDGVPGDGDLWIAPGRAGLPPGAWGDHSVVGSTPDWLCLPGWSDEGAVVFGLRWSDLRTGGPAAASAWPAGDDLNVFAIA